MPDSLLEGVTLGWIPLSKCFYKKSEVYLMEWSDIEIDDYVIAISPTGLIAMIRDDKKILTIQKQSSLRPTICIYNGSGALLTKIIWEKGRLISLGWTDDERLVCVVDNGTIRLYSLDGDFEQLTLGLNIRTSVIDCRIYGNGLVALTNEGNFIGITAFENIQPRNYPISVSPLSNELVAWEIIPPQISISRCLEICVNWDNCVVLVDAKESRNMVQALSNVHTNGEIKAMAVSNNGKLFSCLSSFDNNLIVYSFEKANVVFDSNIERDVQIKSLCWCGSDTVLLHLSNNTLRLLGPTGRNTFDYFDFMLPDAFTVRNAIDGAYIISNSSLEFIFKVPNSVEEVFKFGSTAPGALLYEASLFFQKHNPKCDELIRTLDEVDLQKAIKTCIEAACNEFEPSLQKQLLKGAHFGKCYVKEIDAETLTKAIDDLRVLNSVRDYRYSIPLTISQFRKFTTNALLSSLMKRGHYLFALKIAEYINHEIDPIIIAWTVAKARFSDEDDIILCQEILQKLSKLRNPPFAAISTEAFRIGRANLATLLLENEKDPAEQVPLLIRMQEDELALEKAVFSCNPDLSTNDFVCVVYLVLLHLRRKHPINDLFRMVNSKPIAYSLLEEYCREKDEGQLEELYYQDDRHYDAAILYLKKYFNEVDFDKKILLLEKALKYLKEDKFQQTTTKFIEDELRLSAFQAHLEASLKIELMGLSLADTIYALLKAGHLSKANNCNSDFKFSDRAFYWLRLRAFVSSGDWDGLWKFSNHKKSLIGYKPYVEELVAVKKYSEAIRYVPLCPSDDWEELYLELCRTDPGLIKIAAEELFNAKQLNALISLRDIPGLSHLTTSDLARKISTLSISKK